MSATLHRYSHDLLAQRHAVEVERFVAALCRAQNDTSLLTRLDIEHEDDNRCCEREQWRETLLAMMQRVHKERHR